MIPNVAVCLHMCPPQKINHKFSRPSHFEQYNNGTGAEVLSIKEFHKAIAGDQTLNDPNLNRPPRVLSITVDYIINCIIDQDCCPPG